MWPPPQQPLTLNDPRAPVDLHDLILATTLDLDTGGQSAWALGASPATRQGDRLFQEITGWARVNAIPLGLEPPTRDIPIALDGIHVTFRQAQDGQPRPEIVIQLSQRRKDFEDADLPENDRAVYRAGTTVIARIDGQVDFVISKPLPCTETTLAMSIPGVAAQHRAGEERRAALDDWFSRLERQDPVSPWTAQAAAKRVDFAAIHAQDADGGTP